MIAHLQGIVLEKGSDEAVIDVHGVGYRVFISLQTLEKLPEIGKSCHLLIHTQVREDAFHLYGFSQPEERSLFKYLNNVNGIGPRLALAILSTLSPRSLVSAIVSEDLSSLVQVPGIGKKIAQRIVIELKERLAPMMRPGGDDGGTSGTVATGDTIALTGRQTLLSALLNLGYKRSEAERAIQALPPETLTDIPQGIRAALKVLAK
ncbi:MAG: Holliday junction branch migration protein RuvA [Magnetococcales bacterium]|nr:Holliday junction branch migration protein RuvA [Magnetococcales bacterium]MBF0151819.1 Holliday junction branch migration protein RuvA [Magnetococcales bacterium]MBF0174586.1 Holliday junction branch migration protein RuvA [Magnetococcales bacterium]MBF0346743.1 Holliday junction branch migration protein RuvA [Magnetococcales bacterium]MBF0630374.1 Holliday junction branch migration protein RuvA [Magnetococcales bacterium]